MAGYVEKSQVNVGLIVGILLGILGVLALISQRNRLLSFCMYNLHHTETQCLVLYSKITYLYFENI